MYVCVSDWSKKIEIFKPKNGICPTIIKRSERFDQKLENAMISRKN